MGLETVAQILVIDDDRLVLKTVTALLRKQGFRVETAHEGRAGVEKALQSRYDVIIVDIRMPDMGGMEILRRIKADQKNDCAFIIITGYADEDTAIEAIRLGGVTGYLKKPFESNELFETINKALAEVQTRREEKRLLESLKDQLARLKRLDLIPRKHITDLTAWIEEKLGVKLHHISGASFPQEQVCRNIENYFGVAQVPLGLVGPLVINGDYAKGKFYVPMATTEGALVESYTRGAIAISKAGGARVKILREQIHLSPVFILNSIDEIEKFTTWVQENWDKLRVVANNTTRHGKLLSYEIIPLTDCRVVLKLNYFTGDAMGLNMINFASEAVCEYICKSTDFKKFYLRSNYSSDKKASYQNFLECYGKEVVATVELPHGIIKNVLGSTAEAMYDFWYTAIWGGMEAGMLGLNAQFANALAAIFIASGQDVAQIVNASIGVGVLEHTVQGLRATIKAPSLVLGTVGGGTGLPTQTECLEIMGCSGSGKARKFAEIVAATLLAGEISICAALGSGYFLEAHKRKRCM